VIAAESVEMDGRMRQAFEDGAELLWSFESADGQSATFVALLGEQVIAFAKAHFGRTAMYLGGAQYQDVYRLCYVRGSEGILVGLADQLG
jgi:hypothetical protein